MTAAHFLYSYRRGKLILILRNKEDDIATGRITAKTLCRLTTLTDQRHRQLAQAGYFPSPERGCYQLEPTIQGLLHYYRERNNKEKESLSGERLLKLRAERKLAELRLEKEEGKVFNAVEVERSWANITLTVRQKFLGLENKISTQLDFTDHQRAVLRREIEEALTELSKPQAYGDSGDW